MDVLKALGAEAAKTPSPVAVNGAAPEGRMPEGDSEAFVARIAALRGDKAPAPEAGVKKALPAFRYDEAFEFDTADDGADAEALLLTATTPASPQTRQEAMQETGAAPLAKAIAPGAELKAYVSDAPGVMAQAPETPPAGAGGAASPNSSGEAALSATRAAEAPAATLAEEPLDPRPAQRGSEGGRYDGRRGAAARAEGIAPAEHSAAEARATARASEAVAKPAITADARIAAQAPQGDAPGAKAIEAEDPLLRARGDREFHADPAPRRMAGDVEQGLKLQAKAPAASQPAAVTLALDIDPLVAAHADPVETQQIETGKPAQTASALRLEAPEGARQIFAAIRAERGGGVDLRLDPPELGKVRIQFSFERGDLVTATVSSERGETLDLMRRNAGELARELQKAGFENVTLSFSSNADTSGWDRERAPDAVAARVEESAPAGPEIRAAQRFYRPDNRFDRLV